MSLAFKVISVLYGYFGSVNVVSTSSVTIKLYVSLSYSYSINEVPSPLIVNDFCAGFINPVLGLKAG